MSNRTKPALVAAIALWLVAVAAGLGALNAYSSAAGAPGAAPERWPAASRLRLESGRFTLVVVAHPHCPCSRATVGELARLLARGDGRLAARVLFVRPPGFDERWVETDLWHAAAAIPGATAVRDPEGREARLFGAETSGQTMLYGPGGDLLFSGGITPGRGHAGDNAGSEAILARLGAADAPRAATDVYGCPLHDRADHCPKGTASSCTLS